MTPTPGGLGPLVFSAGTPWCEPIASRGQEGCPVSLPCECGRGRGGSRRAAAALGSRRLCRCPVEGPAVLAGHSEVCFGTRHAVGHMSWPKAHSPSHHHLEGSLGKVLHVLCEGCLQGLPWCCLLRSAATVCGDPRVTVLVVPTRPPSLTGNPGSWNQEEVSARPATH